MWGGGEGCTVLIIYLAICVVGGEIVDQERAVGLQHVHVRREGCVREQERSLLQYISNPSTAKMYIYTCVWRQLLNR